MRTVLSITDSLGTHLYYFNWTLAISKNSGPPYFAQELKPVNLPINLDAVYVFPKIIEPDGDLYNVEILLGKAGEFGIPN